VCIDPRKILGGHITNQNVGHTGMISQDSVPVAAQTTPADAWRTAPREARAMRISLGAGVCVVVIGVLWRGAIDESAPDWLQVTATAVIVIGSVAIAVTLSLYALLGPVEPCVPATLLLVAGLIGMLSAHGADRH
jgi:hypothetical protein